jgi:hypothetical protein
MVARSKFEFEIERDELRCDARYEVEIERDE